MVCILGASPPPALPDLGPRPVQHFLVGGVFPEDHLFDDPEQAVPLKLRGHVTERLSVGLFVRHCVGRRASRLG